MSQSWMTIDSEVFRTTLRYWVSGVTIVASRSESFDDPRGMTVSSFTSVSLEPPLILVCLFKETETVQAIMESQAFAVSLLGVDQAYISSRFAGGDSNFPEETNRFVGLETLTLETGSPLLKDALAHLDCRVWEVYDGGTHFIFVGEVVASQINGTDSDLNPLVYSNQGYHRLMPSNEDNNG